MLISGNVRPGHRELRSALGYILIVLGRVTRGQVAHEGAIPPSGTEGKCSTESVPGQRVPVALALWVTRANGATGGWLI